LARYGEVETLLDNTWARKRFPMQAGKARKAHDWEGSIGSESIASFSYPLPTYAFPSLWLSVAGFYDTTASPYQNRLPVFPSRNDTLLLESGV